MHFSTALLRGATRRSPRPETALACFVGVATMGHGVKNRVRWLALKCLDAQREFWVPREVTAYIRASSAAVRWRIRLDFDALNSPSFSPVYAGRWSSVNLRSIALGSVIFPCACCCCCCCCRVLLSGLFCPGWEVSVCGSFSFCERKGKVENIFERRRFQLKSGWGTFIP